MNHFILTRVGGALLLALAHVACSEDLSRDHGARPWASDDSWTDVQLEAVSDANTHFRSINVLAVGRRGTVYVADWGTASVLVLDSLLAPLTTIGREGEGPGEFVYMNNIQTLPGDSLLVYDVRIRRVTVFPEGRHDSNRMTVVPTYVSKLWRLGGSTKKHLAVSYHIFSANEGPEADEEANDVYSILDESAQAMEFDSILVVPSSDALVVRESGGIVVGGHPFGREGIVRVLPSGGFAYVNTGALSVTVVDADENQTTSFSYPTVPTPVSSEHLESFAREEPFFAKALQEGAPYTWPPVVGLAVDDRDRIWVGLRGQPGDENWEWAAFTRDGRHVGSVRLPSGFRVQVATSDKLLGVASDELDVPQLRVYRILWNGG